MWARRGHLSRWWTPLVMMGFRSPACGLQLLLRLTITTYNRRAQLSNETSLDPVLYEQWPLNQSLVLAVFRSQYCRDTPQAQLKVLATALLPFKDWIMWSVYESARRPGTTPTSFASFRLACTPPSSAVRSKSALFAGFVLSLQTK